MGLGDDFHWLGDQSSNQEAPEVSLRGSWMLCTLSLVYRVGYFYTITMVDEIVVKSDFRNAASVHDGV